MSRPYAVKMGTIKEWNVDCYVLDDGRRVLSQRGIIKSLTGRDSGDLGTYIERIPGNTNYLASGAIEFFPPRGGGLIMGREADDVVKLYDRYIDLGLSGQLHPSQMHLAQSARTLLRALGGVAIVALVDEATGYDAQRAPGFLADLFARIFSKDKVDWDRMFQPSLVTKLCQLDGIEWNGGVYPHYLASTLRKIYDTIFSSVIGREIKKRNPQPSFRSNHHQMLSDEVRSYLKQELRIVEAFAKTASSKEDFWSRMEHHYQGGYLQTELILDS